jgi:hypothetical protein
VIRGTLEEFSLAEIIRLISQTRRTGVLEINGLTGRGRVEFRDGAICGAESNLSREPLGRKLVRSGVLSESQLWNALSRQEKSPRRLGETLVSAGLAAPEDVDSALREQIEDSIVDVLRLEPTEFSWSAEAPHEGVVVLPAENLLAALSDRMHELETIKSHIPSEDASVSLAPIPPFGADEIRLSLDDWRVLVFLGARRTVHDLLHYSGSGETQMLRSLERLVSAGLIEVTDPTTRRHNRISPNSSSTPSAPPLRPSRSEFQEAGVIRLPDGGTVSLVAHDVFKVAVVGSSPLGLSPVVGAIFADLAEQERIEVSCWCTSGSFAHDETLGRGDVESGDSPARPLEEGRLKDTDLVIGLDWANVAHAIGHGSARPEITFTLLELWALADTPPPDKRGVTRRAREVVERANARRIHNARLLSTLELVEASGNDGPDTVSSDQNERLEEVCRRLAIVLFAQS